MQSNIIELNIAEIDTVVGGVIARPSGYTQPSTLSAPVTSANPVPTAPVSTYTGSIAIQPLNVGTSPIIARLEAMR